MRYFHKSPNNPTFITESKHRHCGFDLLLASTSEMMLFLPHDSVKSTAIIQDPTVENRCQVRSYQRSTLRKRQPMASLEVGPTRSFGWIVGADEGPMLVWCTASTFLSTRPIFIFKKWKKEKKERK